MGHEIQKFRLVGGMAGAVARDLISGDAVSPPDRFPKGQSPEHSGDEACVEGIPGPGGVPHVHLERFREELALRSYGKCTVAAHPGDHRPPVHGEGPYGVLPIVFGAEGIEFIEATKNA